MALQLPSDYRVDGDSSQKKRDPDDDRFFHLGQLEQGVPITLRPCGYFDTGHWIHGVQYFTTEGECKKFPVRPKEKDYINEINYKWGHGPGKTTIDKKTKELVKLEDKDYPKPFIAFTAICKQRKKVIVVNIDKATAKKAFDRVLLREDTSLTPDGLLNVEIEITKSGEMKDTTYDLTVISKPPTATAVKGWNAAKDGIWTQALFEGADPFDGKPANSKLKGLPPTARDELGADQEITNDIPEEW